MLSEHADFNMNAASLNDILTKDLYGVHRRHFAEPKKRIVAEQNPETVSFLTEKSYLFGSIYSALGLEHS